MAHETAPEKTEQPRNPILVEIDRCVKEAVGKGKRINLSSEDPGSLSTRQSFSTVLGTFSQTEVENAITVFGSETLDFEKPESEVTLPPKNGTPNKTVRRQWEAKDGTFFLGNETTTDRRGVLLNKTYYVRGAKESLAERLKRITAPLLHPQN